MKKILYIEDEKDQTLMIQTRIEDQGYSFVSACDGEEGIKKIDEEKPDLILLDLLMPKIDGHGVCRYLKDNPETSKIPVIILTASGAKDMEKGCLALGAKEIVHKPYDSAYLLERIAFYLSE